MHERDLWWKIVIVGGLMALAYASVTPFDEKMKLGIDLAGGYSLLYEIDDHGLEGADKAELSKRVMTVLQRRVDPKGVFNLVWRPIGHNRIEIQMPRPSDSVIAARKKIRSLQEELRATIVRRSSVLQAVAKDVEGRSARFEALAGGIKERGELLDEAAKAYDELEAMKKAYAERTAQIAQDTLAEEAVLAAVKTPAPQREAAIQAIIGGIPARKALLDAAAAAWDASEAAAAAPAPAEPATQPALEDPAALNLAFDQAVKAVLDANLDPNHLTDGATIDEVVRREEALDGAIGKVVATNVDLHVLQLALEQEKKKRAAAVAKIAEQHADLATLITDLATQTDAMENVGRGEGRLEDPADLQRLLRGAGVLEFRILPARTNDPIFETYRETLRKRGPRPLPGEENYAWFEIEDPAAFFNFKDMKTPKEVEQRFDRAKDSISVIADRYGDKYYTLAHIGEDFTMVHGGGGKDWSLKSALFQRDQNGRPAIGFNLDEIGGSKFGKLTLAHKNKQLCIFLDDQAVSHATIITVIRSRGQITGDFTRAEVEDAVKKLNAGSLPQKLKDPPISVRSIGPSLGEANKKAGLNAALYGAAIVAIFMIVYYFYAGGIAVIAVGLNILLIGAMMSVLGATLTLPGIAGLVLAVGMAVDANVLINERIREELARGTAMRMAIKLGYERAFRAILDSNVTTVLTCAILYMVGSEEVKGFGLTLGVGVFINIFTAYFVTRMFFDLMSMITVPKEVIRSPIFAAIGITAFGGLLYGLGYYFTPVADRAHSVAMGFGRGIVTIGPAILGFMLLMFIARMLHSGRSRVPMLRLIGVPKIDWVGRRGVFYVISGIMLAVGMFGVFSMDRSNLYDIEFLGGVSAQIDLREGRALASLDVKDRPAAIGKRLEQSGATLAAFGEAMANAQVTGAKGLLRLRTPGVPAWRLEPFVRAALRDHLAQVKPVEYSDPASEETTVFLKEYLEGETTLTPEAAKAALTKRFGQAASAITSAQVQSNAAFEEGATEGMSYTIVARETAKEIVVEAIMETMEDSLKIHPALTFKMDHNKEIGDVPYAPIRENDPQSLGFGLSDREAAGVDLMNWQGGVAMVLNDVVPPQRISVLQDRLKSMRLQPGFEKHGWRESDVFGLTPSAPGSDLYSRVMVVVVDENYPVDDEQGALSTVWQQNLAEPEVELLQAALQRQASLDQITQFDNQVSKESQIQAYLALALSWLLIIIYVWFRFGNIRWGLAAVAALIHDVLIALGAVAGTYYLVKYIPGLAELLMIDRGFRIDLPMVAALLTVIGYSVNDTIVVFDRIRENRGRMSEITPQMVNDSVNQTLSRTVLTMLTSLISVFTMYILGGYGIHSFSFVLIVGLAIGTYSSIGVASQLLLRRSQLKTA